MYLVFGGVRQLAVPSSNGGGFIVGPCIGGSQKNCGLVFVHYWCWLVIECCNHGPGKVLDLFGRSAFYIRLCFLHGLQPLVHGCQHGSEWWADHECPVEFAEFRFELFVGAWCDEVVVVEYLYDDHVFVRGDAAG